VLTEGGGIQLKLSASVVALAQFIICFDRWIFKTAYVTAAHVTISYWRGTIKRQRIRETRSIPVTRKTSVLSVTVL